MSRPSFIEPMMVCSTENVTPETMAALPTLASCIYPNEYGAFMWVPDLGEDEGYPEDLIGIFALAREYDCCWVRLDRDAPAIGDLPVYGWDRSAP